MEPIPDWRLAPVGEEKLCFDQLVSGDSGVLSSCSATRCCSPRQNSGPCGRWRPHGKGPMLVASGGWNGGSFAENGGITQGFQHVDQAVAGEYIQLLVVVSGWWLLLLHELLIQIDDALAHGLSDGKW